MVSEIVFGFWWKILFADDIDDRDALIPKISFRFVVKNFDRDVLIPKLLNIDSGYDKVHIYVYKFIYIYIYIYISSVEWLGSQDMQSVMQANRQGE